MAADTANRIRLSRRAFLGSSLLWTAVGESLARAAEQSHVRPRSLIILWLQGGPSQLDTFDPHPESPLSGGVQAIKTSAPDILLAEGFQRLAERMHDVALVRSVVSKEGDHERATYHVKTGYRPDPTLVHPSLGAIICHQTSDNVEIPRHIAILPGPWPPRGGYLGPQFDAFHVYDPAGGIPDVSPRVPRPRLAQRVEALLETVERQFAQGRLANLDATRTQHITTLQRALRMMDSEQLKAFDISSEPQAVRARYGDTPFGRACLAALRLIAVGVRCVEVTLDGWDSHVNNREIQKNRVAELDPAFAALIEDLHERQLWDSTVVLCAGEFGRTPRINRLEGRDHWPHGFSVALSGGLIRGGRVVGASWPDVPQGQEGQWRHVEMPRTIADVHATILEALGIDYQQELITPIGRPMKLCAGEPIRELLV